MPCPDPAAPTPTPPPRADGHPADLLAPGQTRSYPAREGHDQFYGYGRVNMVQGDHGRQRRPAAARGGAQLPRVVRAGGPGQASFAVRGTVFARGEPYRCAVLVAPGAYPNDEEAPAGDFHEVAGGPL